MKRFPMAMLCVTMLLAGIALAGKKHPDTASCGDFRTGTFTIKSMPEVTVTRDATTQTERNSKTGAVNTMAIAWVNECAYTLKLIHTDTPTVQKLFEVAHVLSVTLGPAHGSECDFTVMSSVSKTPVRGTFVRKP